MYYHILYCYFLSHNICETCKIKQRIGQTATVPLLFEFRKPTFAKKDYLMIRN